MAKRSHPAPAVHRTERDSSEWLVTNGLGGYAFGTVSGLLTRGYHGYLIAALPAPLGRMMMLNDVIEQIRLPDQKVIQLSGEERAGLPFQVHGAECIDDFSLENGLPVWRYNINGIKLEKRVVMPHSQNTVFIIYRLVSEQVGMRLTVRPSLHFRAHNAPVDRQLEATYVLMVAESRYEVADSQEGQDIPPLRFQFLAPGGMLTVDRIRIHEVVYRMEETLGYPARGDLWSPGYFHAELHPQHDIVLLASTESWEVQSALTPAQAISAESERRDRLVADAARSIRKFSGSRRSTLDPVARELVLAADQFIVSPAGRVRDAARARAAGDEVRSAIAGYPWFTDWGRDTMISLEGLTLTSGRFTEASWILRTFAHSIKDGLIPNLFPETKRDGLYHTADATLWFFHAIARYVEISGDRAILRTLLPHLESIVAHHIRGTLFDIGVDPKDGLLHEGSETLPLTWMDAKKDDWVVTPRRGKPVEINALWYNALKLLESWLHEHGRKSEAESLAERSAQVHSAFNQRFWNAQTGCLFDVIDGPRGADASLRPNQIIAVSLPHPVLDESKWPAVVEKVKEKLLTPFGLRSLSSGDPEYKPTYEGDLLTRDAAYHQGTVWAWLIGPFIDAWLRVYPDRTREAREFLDAFPSHLHEAGLGTISEIFDAEPPFTPRGCVAQAWSVAEVLRCWVKTAGAERRNHSARHEEHEVHGA